jgi:hypothetical protein
VTSASTAGASPTRRSRTIVSSCSASALPSARKSSSPWSIGSTMRGGLAAGSSDSMARRAASRRLASSGCRARAPPATADRISARTCGKPALCSAVSSACTRPVSPLIAARPGRTIGSDRKLRSSRASRGRRPARRNDDLPDPDAPSTTMSRGAGASRSARSRSSPSTIGASRPKKMPASSASSGSRPR